MATQLTNNRLPHDPSHVVPANFVPFERALDLDWNLAMSEGSRFLEGRGIVHETLDRLTKRLDELGINYALAGGMALYSHGFRRVTDDIDLIVTRDDLKLVHQKLDGLGYLRPFAVSKNLRDVQSKVKIEFLITGDFPGDGKPKPISFPDPHEAGELKSGIRVLRLPRLIELKIASALTGVGRTKDIGDVEELIKLLDVPRDLSEQLHEYVRPKYLEIWDSLHVEGRRYVLLWRNKWLTSESASIEQMASDLREAAAQLEEMQADGIVLDPKSGMPDDYAYLVTTDPKIANKYNMQPEDEMFLDDIN
jgi:hypothetical protein